MIAGRGTVKVAKKRVDSIVLWPRPSRVEDVEKFLATTVFIREHLSPRYSHIAKPLRDCLTSLHEKRRDRTKAGKKNTKVKHTMPWETIQCHVTPCNVVLVVLCERLTVLFLTFGPRHTAYATKPAAPHVLR